MESPDGAAAGDDVPVARAGARSRSSTHVARMDRLEHATEDSPHFRGELKHLEEQIERAQTNIAVVLGAMRTVVSAEQGTVSPYTALAARLRDYVSASGTQRPEVVDALTRFSTAINEMEEQRRMYVMSVQSVFVDPINEMIEAEFRNTKELRKRMGTTRRDFEATLAGFAKNVGNAEYQRKYESMRQAYELATLDYVSKMNELEAKKTTEFVDRMAAVVQLRTGFLSRSSDIFSGLAQPMQTLQGVLSTAHSALAEERRILSARRQAIQEGDAHGGSGAGASAQAAKEGYLWKKTRGVRSEWQRRWFVVRGGMLYYLSTEDESPAPRGLVNLLFSSHVFEVISRSVRGHESARDYELQAESDAEMRQWIQVLTNNIGMMLDGSGTPDSGAPSRPMSMDGLMCTECGSPNPAWCSLNLAVPLCIECSGVHRNMGVHISKVRSITLDAVDVQLEDLLRRIGPSAKIVWEAKGAPMLLPTASMPERQQFIKAKYEARTYVDDTPIVNPEATMVAAAGLGELFDVYRCIVAGVNVNAEVDGQTALQASVSCGQLSIALLLLFNGADVNKANADGITPLHAAAARGDRTAVNMLLGQKANKDIADSKGRTPRQLAKDEEVAALL